MTTTRWTAVAATSQSFELGEGPLWDAPRQRVLWVDIPAGTVFTGRLDGDRITQLSALDLDSFTGAVVSAGDGTLLVAGRETLFVVAPDGAVTPGPRLLPAGSGRRLNDGAVDPSGRFLVGSLDIANEAEASGQELVRVEPDRTVTVLDDDLTLSNGLAWSPDGATLYSVDSFPGVIHARPYPDGVRRELFRPGGTPDGLTVDAAGDLWVAMYDVGEVRRYTPDGELTGVVEVDAPHVTSVTFAGPGLDRLLITTTGRLFLADTGARGLPATVWSGFHQEEPCS